MTYSDINENGHTKLFKDKYKFVNKISIIIKGTKVVTWYLNKQTYNIFSFGVVLKKNSFL